MCRGRLTNFLSFRASTPATSCHSERSEESTLAIEIHRFAQDDRHSSMWRNRETSANLRCVVPDAVSLLPHLSLTKDQTMPTVLCCLLVALTADDASAPIKDVKHHGPLDGHPVLTCARRRRRSCTRHRRCCGSPSRCRMSSPKSSTPLSFPDWKNSRRICTARSARASQPSRGRR